MSNTSFSLLILLLLYTISSLAHPPEDYNTESSPGYTFYTLKVPTLEETNLDNLLSFGYYHKSCPQFESILHRKVKEWIQKDYTLASSLLKLHFHDCSVRGCDASILLNHDGSERTAEASKKLRGFEVIDDIKGELERHCPKTVSCADILTAATRDATVELGCRYWEVPYGRKDGMVSIAKEAEMVPKGHENITSLVEFLQSKGLNVLDLVVLSGGLTLGPTLKMMESIDLFRAHTIGRASCGSIQNRLYNYQGTGIPDPSIEPKYLNYLQRKCRWASEYVDLDATTPRAFDTFYYINLKKKMGLLSTDQLLYSDPRTSPIVSAIASAPYIFKQQFAVSMAKLGTVEVLTGQDEGEIRTNCNFVNAY